jgi:hypothetical protein
VVNEKTKIEWDIFKTTEWIMDEINWRAIDNKLKDEVRGLHEEGSFDVERDKRRDRMHKLVMRLKEILPEPKIEEAASVIGRDEPEYRPPPTTQESLRKLAETTQRREVELELAFNLNWTVTEPAVIARVVDECWKLEETGRDLWNLCEKLREMILDDRMPLLSCEDRQRMVDNTEQLMERGDWQMDPGSTHHRRIKKKTLPKRADPTEDVHRYSVKNNMGDPRPPPPRRIRW